MEPNTAANAPQPTAGVIADPLGGIGPLLRKPQVCAALCISRSLLDKLVRERKFPQGIRVGAFQAWPVSDVQKFIADKIAARDGAALKK